MKKQILGSLNMALSLFDAKIVRASYDDYDMSSALHRIVKHNMPVKSVIDIGASDGKWSVDSMKVFPGASFLAIEPLYERREALERLRRHNDNFDFVSCAAGDMDGKQVTLNVSEDLDGSTVDGTQGEARKVSLKTIDALVANKKLEGPFLLKFDTHGYEVPILRGAKQTLTETNIIIMEMYNFKITDQTLRFYEMCSYLETMGFSCFDIANPMLRVFDKAFWQMDLFFCKSDSAIFSYLGYK